jgi:hypothetical protein
MTEKEKFERHKTMLLEICNDPRKLCVWENKKFDLSKYVKQSLNGQCNMLDNNIVLIINSILSLAEDNNIPLKITADFSLTK